MVKVGLNYLATKLGYYDGTNFIHYFSSDGDAQLRWNNISHQVVKDTKYEVNMDRVNGVVEIDFNLILSSFLLAMVINLPFKILFLCI